MASCVCTMHGHALCAQARLRVTLLAALSGSYKASSLLHSYTLLTHKHRRGSFPRSPFGGCRCIHHCYQHHCISAMHTAHCKSPCHSWTLAAPLASFSPLSPICALFQHLHKPVRHTLCREPHLCCNTAESGAFEACMRGWLSVARLFVSRSQQLCLTGPSMEQSNQQLLVPT